MSAGRDRFEWLATTGRLPDRLDIVQCDPAWLDDSELRSLRATIDRRLYAAFLRDRRATVVRRLVLYGAPTEAGATAEQRRSLAAEHVRWTDALVRDIEQLDGRMQTRTLTGPVATYHLRQVILPQSGEAMVDANLVSDGVGCGEDSAWSDAFDRLWHDDERTIENNRSADALDLTPPEDRAPSLHLWRTESQSATSARSG